MKKELKKAALAVLTTTAICSMGITSFAADKDDEKIEKVRLELNWDEEPQAGEDAGSIDAKIKESANYTVSSVEYDDKDDETWKRGEIPIVIVELEANEGHRFYSTSKSKFDISGCHSEFKSAKILDKGDGIEIKIKLRKVSGDVAEVEELSWDGKNATWEEHDDADKYEVKLYRGSNNVTTVTTTNNHYNFASSMTKKGDYSFKVRAISTIDGEKSSWTDLSEEYYVSEDDVYKGLPEAVQGSPAGGSGSWIQDQNGWWYLQADGNAVKNSWLYVDNNWFYFGADGYMMTGWVFADNNWFYMNPVSDGTKGAMMTDWQFINGYWYYLNPVSDGTRGARKTGYQMINGNWYFFDLNSGALWTNMTAPNGRWINEAGVIY